MTTLSSSKTRKRHATTLFLSLLVAATLLTPGVSAHESESGEYTASKQWPVDCDEGPSKAALHPFGGGDLTKAPIVALKGSQGSEQGSSTASFSGTYEHDHHRLEIDIEDDIAGAYGSSIMVCTYDADDNFVASVIGRAPLTIYTETAHRSFDAWVEAVHVEEHNLHVTYASQGTYWWAAGDD